MSTINLPVNVNSLQVCLVSPTETLFIFLSVVNLKKVSSITEPNLGRAEGSANPRSSEKSFAKHINYYKFKL
jgi:hypothetical protein